MGSCWAPGWNNCRPREQRTCHTLTLGNEGNDRAPHRNESDHPRTESVRSSAHQQWLVQRANRSMLVYVQRPDALTAVDPRHARAPVVAAYRCLVTEGPDAGQIFDLDASAAFRTLIGTGPACSIRLADPLVSRRHASLELVGGVLRLSDLESTNGTRLQGVRIVEALVSAGESIQIGKTTLRVDPLTEHTALEGTPFFGRVFGTSLEMRRVYSIAKRLAANNLPTIIEGETGTGKEALAESLHEASDRREGPFVVIDCTALAASLVESELFGHERGAFTGAVVGRKGVFEQAHGGTLFIDEIGDLDVSLQAKLLRAIERSEIRRVGGSSWARVDVRVIAATRRDLDKQVQDGLFRDDLFYRLAIGRIELPPLRRRTGDIRFLAELFWTDLKGEGPLPSDVLQRLESYTWPGNVRELQNAVARYVAMGELEPELEPHVPSAPATANEDFLDGLLNRGLPLVVGRQHVVAEYERRYVERVLAEHRGHVGRASAASGIGRRYFQRIRNRSAR
jgi:DNA-binding NtrC family response regulator